MKKPKRKRTTESGGVKWTLAHDRLIKIYKSATENGDISKLNQVIRLIGRTVAQCRARVKVLYAEEYT